MISHAQFQQLFRRASLGTLEPKNEGALMKNTAVLLVQCPDRKGLDASIAEFIYRYDGNILHFEQHQAGKERYFLARVEWDLAGFRLDMKDFDGAFGPIAHKFGMNWCIALGNHRPRVAIFVSKYDHCLVDLLYRQRSGETRVRFSPDDQQSSRRRGTRRFLWCAFPRHFHDKGKQAAGRDTATRTPGRQQHRCGGARPVHAGAFD
jgi:hypothetical protein